MEWLYRGAALSCSPPPPQVLKKQGKTKKRQALSNFYQRGMESYQTGNAELCRLSLGEESFRYGSYKIGWGDTDKESKEIK